MSRFPKIATSRPLNSFLSAGAIAAVMVLSTISSAWAGDAQSTAIPTPKQTATTTTSDREAPTGSHISRPTDMGPIVVFGGAVHGAGDAQWTDDDTSVAELPMAREQDSSKP